MLFITERIACRSVFQTYGRSDIACIYLFDFFSLICVHLKNTADSLSLSLCGIVHIRTGIESSGVYSEERQLAYKRVCHDLECQCSERCIVICRAFRFFFSSRKHTFDRRNIQRGRHIIDNSIQQESNTEQSH